MCTVSIVFARWRQCTRRQSAESCAKEAELVNLPFGLWAQEGRRKHKFNHIGHVAPMYPDGRYIGATWRIRLNRPSVVSMLSYVRLL